MTTDPPKRSWLRSVILVVPVLALTWLAVSLATSGFSAPFKRRDCPSHQDSLPPLALAGDITNVPEFHDCQRFISEDGNAYEGLYGIFISQLAERLWDSLRVLECNATIPGQVGSVRDSIDIPQQLLGGGTCPDGQRQPIAIAFAQIEAFDKPYPPLGVEKGSNCLYLGNTVNPIAVVVPVGTDDRGCLRLRNLGAVPTPHLTVHRQVSGVYAASDYPAVARWDREPHGASRYLAGVVCGAGWCDAGPTDFTHAAARGYPNPGGMPATATRTLAIKGWYDEQPLATTNWWGKLVPSKMVGVAYPDPGIDDIEPEAFRGDWILTAHVALIGGDPTVQQRYKTLYNYDPTGIGAKANHYFLCQGTPTECKIPAGKVTSCANSTDPWWGRIDPAGGGESRYRCEVRQTHRGGSIPRGVVRWRWLAEDEDLWKRCASGCCQPT